VKCECPILEETENPFDRDTRLKKEDEEAAEAAKLKRRPPRADNNTPEAEADNAEVRLHFFNSFLVGHKHQVCCCYSIGHRRRG
jgi:hypothetical protein